MPIIVKCACGKTLKIDEKYRGKKAVCPACNAPILVEGPDDEPIPVEVAPETNVQTSKPTKKPAKAPASEPEKPKKAAEPVEDPNNPFAVPSGTSTPPTAPQP